MRIYLAPAALVALRRRSLARQSARMVAAWAPPEASRPAWQAGLPGLSRAVAELGGGRVVLTLAGHFFRYQLCPWQDGMQRRDEAEACARHALIQIYGADAETWGIALSDEPPGKARLAAAYDAGMLDELGKAVAAGGGKLVSVRPSLAAAVNAWRREIGGKRTEKRGDKRLAWFVLHESGLLTLAMVAAGEWCWVRTRRAGRDWRERLAGVLAEEALLAGGDPLEMDVLLVCPEENLSPDDVGLLPGRLLSLKPTLERLGLEDGRFEFVCMD